MVALVITKRLLVIVWLSVSFFQMALAKKRKDSTVKFKCLCDCDEYGSSDEDCFMNDLYRLLFLSDYLHSDSGEEDGEEYDYYKRERSRDKDEKGFIKNKVYGYDHGNNEMNGANTGYNNYGYTNYINDQKNEGSNYEYTTNDETGYEKNGGSKRIGYERNNDMRRFEYERSNDMKRIGYQKNNDMKKIVFEKDNNLKRIDNNYYNPKYYHDPVGDSQYEKYGHYFPYGYHPESSNYDIPREILNSGYKGDGGNLNYEPKNYYREEVYSIPKLYSHQCDRGLSSSQYGLYECLPRILNCLFPGGC